MAVGSLAYFPPFYVRYRTSDREKVLGLWSCLRVWFLRLRRQIGNDGEVFDEALPGQNELKNRSARSIDEDETSDIIEVARDCESRD